MKQRQWSSAYIFCNVIVFLSIGNGVLSDMISKPETLIKEDETTTLWCSSGMEGGKCNWRSPTEEKCIIVHKDYGDLSNCMDGASASWSPYGKGNCTITITSDVVERNGDWQCFINTDESGFGTQSVGVVSLKIAKPARVELTEYGTLHVSQGEELSVECTAEHGQPLGQFLWKIGEDSEEENAVIWTNKEDPIVEVDEEGYFTSTQKILYTADMAHSGKQLHCIYEQRDMEGNNMFEGNQDDEDETLIIVRYLDPSSNETEWLQHAVEGQNYTISKYFKASPIPDAAKGEIFWEVLRVDGSGYPQRYPLPEIDSTVDGNYLIKALENTKEKHVYVASLTILNPTAYDEQYTYTLKIQRKRDGDEDEAISEKASYTFQMSVESDGAINGNDEAERKVVQEGMGTTTLIVIIVVIVLLLIIGIAVALYFVRKNKSCCFSTSNTKNVESGGAANMTVDDQMTTQPLNYGDGIPDEGDKTTRPIIKPEWARPQ